MKYLAFALLVLAVAVSAVARDTSSALRPFGSESGADVDAEITIFYECIPLCEVTPGWTVINGGSNTSGNSWNVPFGCGTGMVICPPDDPTDGRSFLCPYGMSDEFQDELLTSPAINASGVSSLTLTFTFGFVDFSYCTDSSFVEISTDGSTFTPIFEIKCSDPYVSGTQYTVDVPIDGYAGQPVLYLRFHYVGTWAYSWFVDEIYLYGEEFSAAELATWTMIKGMYR